MNRISITAALGLFFGMGAMRAQEPVVTQTVTLKSLALQYEIEAAQAAIDACTASVFPPVVVITDSRGDMKLIMVADGGQYGFAEEARRKAYTAVTLRRNTEEMQKAIIANPTMLVPPDPQLLIAGGGAQFLEGSTLVGAIGVDGSGSPALEQKCADAGVEKLRQYLHPDLPEHGGPPPH